MVLLGLERTGQRLDELERERQLLLRGRRRLRHVPSGGRRQAGGEAHRREHQPRPGWTERGEALALRDDDGPDAHAAALLERLAQRRVGLAPRPTRAQPVGHLEVGEVDVTGGHEVADLDRVRARHPRALEILVGHDDEAAFLVLVALDDVLPVDLHVLLGAEAPIIDRRLVLLVEEAEVELGLTACRRVETDGKRHQPEGDQALPEWPHGAYRRRATTPPCPASGRSLSSVVTSPPDASTRSTSASPSSVVRVPRPQNGHVKWTPR